MSSWNNLANPTYNYLKVAKSERSTLEQKVMNKPGEKRLKRKQEKSADNESNSC